MSVLLSTLAVLLVSLSGSAVAEQKLDSAFGNGPITADQVIRNEDSSVTFIKPWVTGKEENAGQRLQIRSGVPGACRLFGLDDFLRGHVVWSKDMMPGVGVGKDGTIGDVEPGHYIESMTCTSGGGYVPMITFDTLSRNPDGSATISMPLIHTGVETYPIISGFAAGACRLLGYNSAIQYSQEWSNEQARGVSLGYDGQIYDKSSGTYLTEVRCKNKPMERYSSPGRGRFEERIREWENKD